jgi:hypothetical protein
MKNNRFMGILSSSSCGVLKRDERELEPEEKYVVGM